MPRFHRLCGQIAREATSPLLAAQGYKAIINNRPDGEGGPQQPTSAQTRPRPRRMAWLRALPRAQHDAERQPGAGLPRGLRPPASSAGGILPSQGWPALFQACDGRRWRPNAVDRGSNKPLPHAYSGSTGRGCRPLARGAIVLPFSPSRGSRPSQEMSMERNVGGADRAMRVVGGGQPGAGLQPSRVPGLRGASAHHDGPDGLVPGLPAAWHEHLQSCPCQPRADVCRTRPEGQRD